MSKPKTPLDVKILERRKEISVLRLEIQRMEGELDGLRRARLLVAEDTSGIIYDVDSALEKIEERTYRARQRLKNARANLAHLEGELEGFRTAREIAQGNQVEVDDLEEIVRNGPEISAAWRKILSHFVQRLPNPLSIGDVMAFIEENGLKINRNAVRSQLHLYAQRGFLRRVSDGLYQATDVVKRLC